MPWKSVLELIGPGIHWNKPRELFLKAIQEAEARQREDVAEHIRIILRLRDRVKCDTPKGE